MHDLDTRLERLAADATRDAVVPEPEAIARRGRRRRRRQLAGSATLLVVAIVVAGMVLPARRADHRTGHPAAGPATDVSEAGMLTGHWFGKADASVFLAQHVDPARRQAIHDRIQALDVVDAVFFESRQEAYDRAKVLYRNRPSCSRTSARRPCPRASGSAWTTPTTSSSCSRRCAGRARRPPGSSAASAAPTW